MKRKTTGNNKAASIGKNDMQWGYRNQQGRTINPVLAIVFLINVAIFVILLAINMIASGGIRNALWVLAQSLVVIVFVIIFLLLLTHLYYFISDRIRGKLRRRAMRAIFPDSPSRRHKVSRPSRKTVKFAPNAAIEARESLVTAFWAEILGTDYRTSFVSDESTLSSWEHYLPGGKMDIIKKVKERYGVDISECYEQPVSMVLDYIEENKPLKTS